MSAKCGTIPGYRVHLATRTPPCRSCLAAESMRNRCWRIRKGHTTHTPLSIAYLGELLKLPEFAARLRADLGDDLCDAISYACGKKAA